MLTLRKADKGIPAAVKEQNNLLRECLQELEDESEDFFVLQASIDKDSKRLDELPAAIDETDRERFQYLSRRELDRTLPDREQDFHQRREQLVRERETLQGKLDASRRLLHEVEQRLEKFRSQAEGLRRAVWAALYEHICEQVGPQLREGFIRAWVVANQLTNGIYPMAVLDRLVGNSAIEGALRSDEIEKIKAEFEIQ